MANRYLTVVWEASWEESASKITPSPREMDDYMRAAEIMAQRGLAAQDIEIPRVPGTNVYVFRMEAGPNDFPPTRWFFKVEDEKACFVWVEATPPDEEETS